MPVSADDIRSAAALIKGQITRTPLVRSGALSKRYDADVFLKLETLQHTGSFKDRGALVKLLSLSAAQRKNGVIAISAGNHAQGVAYHAQRLGIPATIVMPEATPFNKIRRTKAYGAHVELFGENVNAAKPYADRLAKQQSFTFVHPYDDDKIIAGQGTIGLELLDDCPGLDTVIVPIGGGGLISGIAVAAKSVKPGIEIIGVEAAAFPSMYNAVYGNAPTGGRSTIAEGIAVTKPGVRTKKIVSKLVDDILLIEEPEIEWAIQSMLSDAKTLAEGAGAIPLAALAAHPDRFTGKTIALIVCGANIDPRLLSSVLLRGMVRDGQMARLRVTINDEPGMLAKVAEIIGEADGNIVEVLHQRMFYDLPVKQTDLDVVLETRDAAHLALILEKLRKNGLVSRQLSDKTSV